MSPVLPGVYCTIHNTTLLTCHREEQTKEQEEADRRGYEEGEESRREQEREKWLVGLEEVVKESNRKERKCCF